MCQVASTGGFPQHKITVMNSDAYLTILCKQTGSINLKRLVFATDVPCSQHREMKPLSGRVPLAKRMFHQTQASYGEGNVDKT